MIITERELRAKYFAHGAHGAIDHRRKYTNEPYIVHPAAVVALLRTVPHTPLMLIAGWLHDVVEDTGCTLAMLATLFGEDVASKVEMLTDVSKPEDGLRAARKQIDREHTAKADPDMKSVKLADLIHNAESILQHDLNFARVFFPEMNLLLGVLTDGDPTLWAKARAICDRGLETISTIPKIKKKKKTKCRT